MPKITELSIWQMHMQSKWKDIDKNVDIDIEERTDRVEIAMQMQIRMI